MSSTGQNKRRSRTDRILQRLSFIVLLWAVVTPFLADAQDGGRKGLGEALANSVCGEYMNMTMEDNPECFSVSPLPRTFIPADPH